MTDLLTRIEAGEATDANRPNWWKMIACALLVSWLVKPPLDILMGWRSLVYVAPDGAVIRAQVCLPDHLCQHMPSAALVRAVEADNG
jgi:hypothetical protein